MAQVAQPAHTPAPVPQLLAHQVVVAQYILSRPFAGIFLGVGGGKTLSVLTALYLARPAGHMLVIAPKNIARATWPNEIEDWDFRIRTKSLIVDDNDRPLTRAARLKLYEEIPNEPPTMYFINQDLIKDLVDNMPVVKFQDGRTPSGRIRYRKSIQWPFDTVIIDESQGFKNASASRVKALLKVRGAITRMIQLTGTPTPNGLLDLWAQVYLLDQGASLGEKFTDYRAKYFHPTVTIDDRPVQWEINGPEAEIEIYDRIKHLVMSAQNTTLPLPAVSLTEYKVKMDKATHEAYKDFAKQSVLDIIPSGSTRAEAYTIIAANRGVLNTKLLQYSSGTLYIDPLDENGDPIVFTDKQSFTIAGTKTPYEVIHTEKLQMLEYLINGIGPTPIIICYRYRSDHAEIIKWLTKLGLDVKTFDGSRSMLKDWNEKRIPILLLQPASAGHGLNFQHGGHHLIWYTLPDSLEHWIQANGRLYRIGQQHPVEISYLTTMNTLDARQPSKLQAKEQDQRRLVEAVHMHSGNDDPSQGPRPDLASIANSTVGTATAPVTNITQTAAALENFGITNDDIADELEDIGLSKQELNDLLETIDFVESPVDTVN